jgi:enterochelin esterase-like enzyme
MLPRCILTIAVAFAVSVSPVRAQGFKGPPPYISPEVSPERKITFRILAPKAAAVKLASSDLPSQKQGGVDMTKGDNDIWSTTVGPVPAGAYRYNFNVDGVTTLDPRNGATSESNGNAWSLVTVPGSDVFDLRNVPHGSVAKVPYYSTSLGRMRRMHVYTPPGYDAGASRYPVFYLLHGAFDSDASWSTVGQAGQILDNLIASGKAKPMIVVMPMGHTGAFGFGPGANFQKQMDEFVVDFQKDIRPFVEKRYRVLTERKHRAIAGLSMGGAHTLSIAFSDLGDYGYVGVFSSGVFGIDQKKGDAGAAWMTKHKDSLGKAELRKGLKTLWFATGKDDFLLGTTKATVAALKDHGFDAVYKETDGGHTWLNWRDYLAEFAPMLFTDLPAPAQAQALNSQSRLHR